MYVFIRVCVYMCMHICMGVHLYARYASVITASGCASGTNRVCIGHRAWIGYASGCASSDHPFRRTRSRGFWRAPRQREGDNFSFDTVVFVCVFLSILLSIDLYFFRGGGVLRKTPPFICTSSSLFLSLQCRSLLLNHFLFEREGDKRTAGRTHIILRVHAVQ